MTTKNLPGKKLSVTTCSKCGAEVSAKNLKRHMASFACTAAPKAMPTNMGELGDYLGLPPADEAPAAAEVDHAALEAARKVVELPTTPALAAASTVPAVDTSVPTTLTDEAVGADDATAQVMPKPRAARTLATTADGRSQTDIILGLAAEHGYVTAEMAKELGCKSANTLFHHLVADGRLARTERGKYVATGQTTRTPSGKPGAVPRSESAASRAAAHINANPTQVFTSGDFRTIPGFEACKDLSTTLHKLAVEGKVQRPERGLYCALAFEGDLAAAVAGRRAAAANEGIAGKIKAAAARRAPQGNVTSIADAYLGAPWPTDPVEQAKRERAGLGACPWCNTTMKAGDEDPILDRVCAACEEPTFNELRAKYPEAAKRYDAEIVRQRVAKHAAAAAPAPEVVEPAATPATTVRESLAEQMPASTAPAPTTGGKRTGKRA